MVKEQISLSFAFRPRSNIGTDKYAVYFYLIQTHLYLEHHTETQLVPLLKSLVGLNLWVD